MIQKVINFILVSAFAVSPVWAVDVDVYGSLKMGFEAVDPDGGHKNYVGVRDAASRIGVTATEKLDEGWSVTAKLELPFDSANLDVHAPSSPDSHVRVANVRLDSPYGFLEYGQGWLPYYDHIAEKTDQFNSYYSGWSTLTSSRRKETLRYETPELHGFRFAVATSRANDDLPEQRNQYVATYSNDGLAVAVGRDDRGEGSYATNGIAVAYTATPWHFVTKYEEMDSDDASDGKSLQNVLVRYTLDEKNVIQTAVSESEVKGYGDRAYHLGWKHQYDDALKLFLEYYEEEKPSAISSLAKESGPAAGGNVVTTGFHYDF